MSELVAEQTTSIDIGRRAAERAEKRMLIDGRLVTAASGDEFDNLSPATGLVLGATAAAGPDDMEAAIASARRAFDESDWPTNRVLRQRSLLQLQEAIEAEKEILREELIAEVGAVSAEVAVAMALGWVAPGATSVTYPWLRDGEAVLGATGAEIGPYARLRPGTVVGEKAKIGNFVETKKAVLGEGAKANHLTYLGDAEIGLFRRGVDAVDGTCVHARRVAAARLGDDVGHGLGFYLRSGFGFRPRCRWARCGTATGGR